MSVRTSIFPARAFAALASALLLVGGAGCASTPRFQGMTAAELYALGQREFEEGDWDDAAEALDRLLLSFPEFAQAAEARLLLAQAYFNDERYLVAADEYVRFLDRHAGHAQAPQAALGACRAQAAMSPITQRDQTYTVQAAMVCRNVATDWGRFEGVAQEAGRIANEMREKLAKKEYDNGKQYFDRDAHDSAIIYWELVVEQYPDTVWAAPALLGIIRAYQEIGYEDLVEEYTQRLLDSYPDSEAAREVRGGGEGG